MAEIDELQQRIQQLEEALAKANQERSTTRLADLEEEEKRLQRIVNNLQNRNDIQDKATLIARQTHELDKVSLQVMQKKIKEQGTLTEEELKRYEVLKETVSVREEALKIEEQLSGEIVAGTGLQQQFNAKAKQMAVLMEQGKLGAYGMVKGLEAMNNLSGKVLDKFVSTVTDMLFQFDEVTKGFQKATQLGDEYTDSIKNTYTELNLYGVSLEEAAESTKSLVGNVTDFTLASKGQRDALIQTSARLAELGISANDMAAGVQVSMKFFGQSMNDANVTAQELEATARGLGMVPGELAAEYAKSGAALAKFGDQGTKTFKDLARLSKITGMDIQKLLNITNKFDTFEGAATQAGKLNAALGGNFVNAMDLMMATDPSERFMMIRDSITNAGLSFDTMSYYQRKYFAEAAGLDDVGDLALMLSGNMDMLTGAQDQNAASIIEQKKRAQEQMLVQEKLKAALLEVAEAFLPLVGYLEKFAHWIQENTTLVKWLVRGFIAWKVMSVAIATANAIMTASFFGLAVGEEAAGKAGRKSAIPLLLIAGALGAIFLAFQFGSPSKIVMAFFALSIGLYAAGAAAKFAAGPLGALAIPLLLVGAGVLMVTGGIGLMVAAFSLLSPMQMAGSAVAFMGMGAGAYVAAPALTALGAAAIAGAPGLGMIALFMGVIAGVIYVAAAGIALMANSFTAMFAAVSLEKVLALGAFFTGIVIGAPYMFIAAAGLAAMGVGFAAMAFGLWLISSKKLASIATFTESLASIEVAQFKEVAETIERIADAMDDMPRWTMFRFAAVMDATELAATAIAAMNRTTAPAQQTAPAAAAGGTGDVAEVTVNLKLDNELLEKKVIKIQRKQEGIRAREIVRGER